VDEPQAITASSFERELIAEIPELAPIFAR
jgi:hypothetical protein